ncbi:MAG: hypothetical protein ABL863_12085 [Nitrosomonas sp.]
MRFLFFPDDTGELYKAVKAVSKVMGIAIDDEFLRKNGITKDSRRDSDSNTFQRLYQENFTFSISPKCYTFLNEDREDRITLAAHLLIHIWMNEKTKVSTPVVDTESEVHTPKYQILQKAPLEIQPTFLCLVLKSKNAACIKRETSINLTELRYIIGLSDYFLCCVQTENIAQKLSNISKVIESIDGNSERQLLVTFKFESKIANENVFRNKLELNNFMGQVVCSSFVAQSITLLTQASALEMLGFVRC